MLSTRCAVYENAPATESFQAGGGAAGSATSGAVSLAGRPNAADGGRYYGGAGNASLGGGIAAGGGETNVTAGGGAGGVSGGAGGAVMPSGGGGADAPGATDGVADSNLSQGKPATSDSEQSHKYHYADDGNDGDRSTRWCATDWNANHYWEVDLGQSFELTFLHILWEQAAPYRFKVESSADRTSWSLAADKTDASSMVADEALPLLPGTNGRYVRITVTGGLSTTVWASFYEVEVYGH